MSDLQRKILKNKLPPASPRHLGEIRGDTSKRLTRMRDYTPLSWDSYFEKRLDVHAGEGNIFRVYTAGNSGPLLLLLHGGGYSGLSWALFCSEIVKMVECQVAAIDLRGHGETTTSNDDDLSAETLANMGGALAVHTAYSEYISSIIGLVVIDVVEGTAMDALQSMQSVLRGRPTLFSSLEKAIEWCIRSGQVRNLESARISMPGQLKSVLAGAPATSILKDGEIPEHCSNILQTQTILEEKEDGIQFQQDNNDSVTTSHSPDEVFKTPHQTSESTHYTWRIDLSKTEKYWAGWFKGLSSMFLSCSPPKMLLLAGIDRLDKDLTIGQMQGKFQMQVLPQCGHAVHEDVPDKVAEAIATFMVRHRFTSPTSDFSWLGGIHPDHNHKGVHERNCTIIFDNIWDISSLLI
ncbi:protein phosphatase methylesterase 1 isoform X2 [Tachypleus tridentatus]|uniref:protein phosphatase methylesterase 1 isoform X2 n=1 Tax=Tachypleus tridentatus TaxID=6853 RepID=UPI003FD45658